MFLMLWRLKIGTFFLAKVNIYRTKKVEFKFGDWGKDSIVFYFSKRRNNLYFLRIMNFYERSR